MASAACPECHVMIVETGDEPEYKEFGGVDAEFSPLVRGDNVAVAHGATEVSNSWGNDEKTKRTAKSGAPDSASHAKGFKRTPFSHPGVVITASSGDQEYGNED